MGCDIHAFAEKKIDGDYVEISMSPDLFDWRGYGLFGFLAGVRNYSATTPIMPNRGLPKDLSDDVQEAWSYWDLDAHSASWLSMDELEKFPYESITEDRRVTRNNDGGCTCEPGEGQKMTYREFLGPSFFEEIERLKALGADRIVFWFDN